jgi:hypothetical protein
MAQLGQGRLVQRFLRSDGESLSLAGELAGGAAAADRGALTDLLHRLSRLAVDVPEVSELDLNFLPVPTAASPSTFASGSRGLRRSPPPKRGDLTHSASMAVCRQPTRFACAR